MKEPVGPVRTTDNEEMLAISWSKETNRLCFVLLLIPPLGMFKLVVPASDTLLKLSTCVTVVVQVNIMTFGVITNAAEAGRVDNAETISEAIAIYFIVYLLSYYSILIY